MQTGRLCAKTIRPQRSREKTWRGIALAQTHRSATAKTDSQLDPDAIGTLVADVALIRNPPTALQIFWGAVFIYLSPRIPFL